MTDSPLLAPVLFQLWKLPVTAPLAGSVAVSGVLVLGAALASRRLHSRPSRWQSALEILVLGIEGQLREIMHTDPRPYLPLLGTLFLFLLTANLSGLLPGVTPPTAWIETAAALAAVVFFSTHWVGIRQRGVGGYLRGYLQPRWFMLPLNLLSELTRTFSLMVRLFGNMMSGHFLIAVVVSLAGLLVPVPLMALELLTGVIQAYIFTVLSAVFIAAAAGATERS